ncbi:MAG TPA: hypothetical protein ENI12_00830 [Nitrospirae bacterium]|nr:hypothetical protein [Nitrospirota bacterium]
MSEEQPREPVERTEEPKQPQEQQKVVPEALWSVPDSQSPRIELPETSFEPLRPLEPTALGEAIADSFMPKPPEFEPFRPDLEERETQRVPMNRPTATPMGDVCPHGLAGMCIWCQRMPCDYLLGRVFRYLLTKIEYGGGVSASTS